MKFFNVFTLFFSLFAFILSSCSKDSSQGLIEYKFVPYFGATELKLDSVYTFQLGDSTYKFRPDELKFFVSNLKLLKEDGTSYQAGSVFLYNLRNNIPVTSMSIFDSVPIGSYDKVVFNIGLSDSLNNLLPNSFPSNHPMSTQQGMYWPMQKYRFMIFEGYVYDKNGKDLNSIAYHTGVNANREVNQHIHLELNKGVIVKVTIKINLEKIFNYPGNYVQPDAEVLTHSSTEAHLKLNTKIMDNLVKGVAISSI